jgi:hypothetical protein
MSKPRPLALVLLLALLVTQLPAHVVAAPSLRQSGQGRRGIKIRPSSTEADKPQANKPLVDKQRTARPQAARPRAEAGETKSQAAEAAGNGSPRLVLQLGHAKFSDGFAAFSPDSRLVATGSYSDNVVVIWDVASGREAGRLTSVTGAPGAQDSEWMWGAFSPDGCTLATGANGGGAVL